METLREEGGVMLPLTSELDMFKDQMYKESLRAGIIEFVGPIAGIAGAQSRDNWTGSISLDKRSASKELESSHITAAIRDVAECYVPTTVGASIRCVDGRAESGYDDDDPAHFGRKFGPQIAGGTIGEAADYRVALGLGSDVSLNSDVSFLCSSSDLYLPGDHTATEHPEGKTGCGALDGIESQEASILGAANTEIEDLERALLGEEGFSLESFRQITENIGSLVRRKVYFSQKNTSLEEIARQNPTGAPTLSGAHNEVLVSLNMVPDTTLHTDHFSSIFSGDIQAFNYDFWRTLDKSGSLFTDDKNLQSKYIHAQVARSIAALMGLTDGSIILLIRHPADLER